MISKQLTIDLWKQLREPITIVQYEAEGRNLIICLTSGGLPINVTAASVVFYAIKPDGNVIYNNCDIVDGAAGKVSYTITGQTCVLPGALRCWIDITAEDVKLRTQEFAITVQASVDSTGAIESTSEFTALEAALAAVSGMTPTRSLERDVDGLHLVNDEATPDEGKFYGMQGGQKGFFLTGNISGPSGQFIQQGWGYIQGNGSSGATGTVTFPVAFDTDTFPIIVSVSLSATSVSGGTPSDPGVFTSGAAILTENRNITNSDFRMSVWNRDSSESLSTSYYYGYSWIAIGTKAR